MNPVKIKYRRLYTLLFFIILACNNNNNGSNNNNVTADTAKTIIAKDTAAAAAPVTKENDILDALNKLPMVKESSKYIDAFTKHKHTMAFIIDTADKEYKVTAGYNGDERFETYYVFSVNKKTREIKVLDAISGEMITPAEYERRGTVRHR